MFCKEIMRPPLACGESESAESAARLMRDHGMGFVPVVDAAGHAVGVLTDRDLAMRVLAAGLPATTPCARVMSRELVTCRPDDTLRRAEEKMREAQKWRIVVADGAGVCVGVISLSDVAQAEGAARTGAVLHDVLEREAPAVPAEPMLVMPP